MAYRVYQVGKALENVAVWPIKAIVSEENPVESRVERLERVRTAKPHVVAQFFRHLAALIASCTAHFIPFLISLRHCVVSAIDPYTRSIADAVILAQKANSLNDAYARSGCGSLRLACLVLSFAIAANLGS